MNHPTKNQFPAAKELGNKGSCWICQRLMLSLLLLFLFCSNGCLRDNAKYSTFVPGLKLAAGTRVVIETLHHETPTPSPAGKHGAFNPDDELAAALEKELEISGLKGQTNAPNVVVLVPIVADYEGGNAFVRSVAVSPDAGRTLLLVRCKLKRDGREIGTINVRRTWEPFSLPSAVASIGQWKIIFQSVAADIVKELKLGIRSNQ